MSVEQLLKMSADLGVPMSRGDRVLDFGCGSGRTVQRLAQMGYDALGVDVKRHWDGDEARLRVADLKPYRLPFPDGSFRLAISEQVFEHVIDYTAAFHEIGRVLEPGGISINVFPSRWRPIESHAFVPFAGAFRPRWYLWLWAALGLRNGFQRGESAGNTVDRNARYLREQTNYLTVRQIKGHAAAAGVQVAFPSRVFYRRHDGATGRLGRLLSTIGAERALAAISQRAMVVRRRDGVTSAAPSS
jgi:SAM-dependent methyltransferase